MQEDRLQRRHPLIQFIFDNWFYIALFILMWQLPHLLGDYFDQDIRPRRPQGNQPVFWMGVVSQLYIFIILAMSYNLIFGFGGIISLGHALFFGVGTYVLVILVVDYSVSLERTLITALGVSAILGLLASVAVFRIKGVYFAMFSLALAQIFYELSRVNLFKFLTEGDDGRTISGSLIPEWINPISERLTFYYVSAFAAALVFLLIRRLMNSPTGKVILAIRDNEERAQTMGYNITRYKTLVLVFSSMLATLAGFMHALFNRGTDPTNLGLTRTVDPLLMTIIGGVGTNPGPVIGAIIIQLGETFFRKPALQVDLNFILFHLRGEVNTVEIWRMILGLVFIFIVLFVPVGVVGQANQLWIQLRHWFRQFIYDPLLRRYDKLAVWMQPFTGEPPAVARALAQASQNKRLTDWVITYPASAFYSLAVILAFGAGLLSWDIQRGISVFLFLWLISAPFLFGIWLYRNYEKLIQSAQDLISAFRL